MSHESPPAEDRFQRAARLEREELHRCITLAAAHFQGLLWEGTEGQAARDYIASRGITEETARAFALGYASASGTALANALAPAGLANAGERAGLLRRAPAGGGFTDVFRGRVTLPFCSPEGHPLSFIGRDLPPHERRKYQEPCISPIFERDHTLFGLVHARDAIRREGSAIVVEGGFDCMMLHQTGFTHSVGLIATTLSTSRIDLLLAAGARELVVMLDPDLGGWRGVQQNADLMLLYVPATRVARLPRKEDPDEFLVRAGPEAMRRVLDEARPLTEYLLDTTLPRGRNASAAERKEAVEALSLIFLRLQEGPTRSALLDALATHSGLSHDELEAMLRSS
ncbi:toprim domain-containing protein [Pyxidicoccus parkwayensis]|uniref:Toprim domain-containing protein n=1 Tax=Pyxidicoccus parkwayensis TaxID=2813578 RepID=A0ABX7NWH3_9BACT|nr:toprim domain-containing protein [Pyxidicoccus parkwaysis]QSQ22776.1 toprim domain-containing protein [Pyxidicoccus parkwaysis]